MSETTHLGLPYLAAAQAQKHVTVNEALARLDALTHLAVLSRALTAPPAEPEEGARYIIAAPASGAWEGEEEKIAAFLGGAWSFIVPRAGFRAYVADEALELLYEDGWAAAGGGAPMGLLGESASGAAFTASVAEVEHSITAGASNDTALIIPDRAVVIGVTGKVTEAITGASTWSLGVAADPQRYGNGIGVMAGSTAIGVSGTPVAYYGATPVRVTAGGPDFTGGKIKLALHYFEVGLPG